MSSDPAVLEGRCYTAARRYPLQIGRFAGGGRMPGGPYTLTQVGVMIGGFVLLIATRPVWGGHGLADFAVVFVVPFAAGWAIHRVQIDHRNPVMAVASLAGVAVAPPTGRLHGRPWRHRPARLLAPRVTLHVHPPVGAELTQPGKRGAAAVLPAPRPDKAAGRRPVTPAQAPGGVPGGGPAVSGVRALLARRAAAGREGVS
ncbi:MAG: hypothetical protein HOY69_38700 [Streptomyces sp.]|nr:hypothetical protein [Streptomyces sp.]